MKLHKPLLFTLTFLLACNQIQTENTLSNSDIEKIQKLNLLDKDEKVYKFYSEFKSDVAGNFFTNKRLAKYWIDKRDNSKNEVLFAYYPDIKFIDTIYNAGATYCPYLLITKTDNSQFKVCVNGNRTEIKEFFEEALDKWTQYKNLK